MPRSKSTNSNTIAFRAPVELLTTLDARCQRLGISRGEFVRAIVTMHFETEPHALAEDIQKLLTKVGMVHRNQARSLVRLLMTFGKLSLEDAKQIARTDLLS